MLCTLNFVPDQKFLDVLEVFRRLEFDDELRGHRGLVDNAGRTPADLTSDQGIVQSPGRYRGAFIPDFVCQDSLVPSE